MIVFRIQQKKCKLHTRPHINIAKFIFIFNMRIFKYYSHMYIKFYNFCMYNTSYTFTLIFKQFFSQRLYNVE